MAKKQKEPEPVSLADVPESDLRAELDRRRIARIMENNRKEQRLARLTEQHANVLVQLVLEHAVGCAIKAGDTSGRYDTERCDRCALLEIAEGLGCGELVADIVMRKIKTEDEV